MKLVSSIYVSHHCAIILIQLKVNVFQNCFLLSAMEQTIREASQINALYFLYNIIIFMFNFVTDLAYCTLFHLSEVLDKCVKGRLECN